jgi:DNA-binding GntR family transcriptional regulator
MALGTTSVVAAVAAAVRRQLLDGQLPQGAVMRDTALSDQYGVARPTVRAAIQSLVADGLLVRDRGRSARVPTFDPAEVADLYLGRRTVEQAALHLIEQHGHPLDTLAIAAGRLTHLPPSATWQEAADLDVEFHRVLVATAGSARLSRMFEGLANESRLLIAFQRPLYDSTDMLGAEHLPMFEALVAGDFAVGRRLLDQHFDEAVAAMAGIGRN